VIGISTAVLLVLDVVLGRWPAAAGCAAVGAAGLLTWYVIPLRARSRPDG
jgi:hypothetical protein